MSRSGIELSRIGAFALEERLGDPPAKCVYRGVHVERRQSFAVRLVPPEVLRGPLADTTFKEEVAALKDLVHPNIVRCYGGSVDEGRPFLALELVAGESVAGRLARRERLPWESAVEITEQLCDALTYAHGRQMLHERVGPDKVLLDETGRALCVKLCGFGAAWADRYAGVSPGQLPLDTARFLAPEQLAGDLPVTARSDLYGVGATLFFMVAGRPPFADAKSLDDLVRAKRTQTPPRISAFELGAPVWLDVLVAKLLTAAPTDRFASARDVREALAEAKRNVQAGVGTAQRVLASPSASLVPAADREALARIRRIKVRKKDDSPFYERAWFLAACLAIVVAAIAWAAWPASEEELYREAAALMASTDSADWYRAQDAYLVPLRERFPEGKYKGEVQAWLDQIEMEQAENRLRLNAQLGKTPSTEAERLYAEGLRYEQFGDRVTALAKYRGLISLLSDSSTDESRPFVNLAKRKINQLLEGDASGVADANFDRPAFLREQLGRADELQADGKRLEAQRIWESIVALYSGNRELAPLVAEAQRQLAQEDETE
jgi:hypothetical protein